MYESYSQNKLPIRYKIELSFLSHSAKHMSFPPKYTPFIPLLHLKCPTFVLLFWLKMSYFCPTFCQKCPTFPTFLTCPTAGHPDEYTKKRTCVLVAHNANPNRLIASGHGEVVNRTRKGCVRIRESENAETEASADES